MNSRLSRRDLQSFAEVNPEQKSQLEAARKASAEIETEFVKLRGALVKNSNKTKLNDRYSRLVKRVLRELPVGNVVPWLSRLLVARLRPGAANEVVFSEYLEELKSFNTRKVCGYVFKEGDLAYNCRSCEADSTCVQCQGCFNDSDHQGHEVSFHKTSPGGCCDCGDEEAWAKSGFCSRHGKDEAGGAKDPRASLPPELRAQAEIIFAQTMPFLSETTSEVIESFAATVGPTPEPPEGDVRYHLLLHHDDVHSEVDVRKILIRRSPVRSAQEAFLLVQRVSKEGRASVRSYPGPARAQLKAARADATALAGEGLLVSVTKASQLAAERRAIACLEWLQLLADHSDGLARCLAHALTEVPVVSRRERGADFLRARCPGWPALGPPPSFSARKKGEGLELSVADGHQPVFLDDAVRFGPLYPKRLVQVMHSLYMHLLVDARFKEMFAYLLVDCCESNALSYGHGIGTADESVMAFSVQLFTVPSVVKWLEQVIRARSHNKDRLESKLLRSLAEVIKIAQKGSSGELQVEIPSVRHRRYIFLTTSYDYLLTLGSAPLLEKLNKKQTAVLKKKLKAEAKQIAKAEEEKKVKAEKRVKELEASVREAQKAAKNAEAESEKAKDDTELSENATSLAKTVVKEKEKLNTAKKKLKALKKGKSIQVGEGNLETLSKFGTGHLELFLDTLRLVQGMDPQKRNTSRNHVLYENVGWEYAFWLTIALNNMIHTSAVQLVQFIATGNDLNEEELYILSRIIASKAFGRIYEAEGQHKSGNQYKVKRKESYALGSSAAIVANVALNATASYHLHLHRFLTRFVMQLAATRYASDRHVVDMRSILAGYTTEQEFNIQLFIEQPLRTLVMAAQIHKGLWKRNGDSSYLQLGNYTNVFFATLHRVDVATLQLGACILPAPKFLTLVLNRFGILRWLFASVGEDVHPLDADVKGLILLRIPNTHNGSVVLAYNALPDEVRAEYQSDLNAAAAGLGEEFFRLLITICTELPTYNPEDEDDDTGGGHAELRRAIVHRLAVGPCSFSTVSTHVRALKIRMRSRAQGAGMPPVGEDEPEILPVATLSDVEHVLAQVAEKLTVNGASHYELRPECWAEFDPVCWYLSREQLQTAQERRSAEWEDRSAAKKPKKKKKAIKVEPCALAAPPPGPVQPALDPVRTLCLSPGLVETVRVVLGDAVTAHRDLRAQGVLMCQLDKDGAVSGVCQVRAANEAAVDRASTRTTVTLTAMALHALTLALHVADTRRAAEAEDAHVARFVEALSQRSVHAPAAEVDVQARDLSLVELLLALRGYSGEVEGLEAQGADLETAGLEWLVRTADRLGDKRVQDQIDAVEGWHREQRLSKKGGKSGMTRAERAKAAQKAAMDRMLKKQKKAKKAAEAEDLEAVLPEDGELASEMASPEERGLAGELQVFECSMCHEHAGPNEERPMVFVGFAQRSAWGAPKPVAAARAAGTSGMVLGSSPSSIVRQPCKPAGWEVPLSYFGTSSPGEPLAAAVRRRTTRSPSVSSNASRQSTRSETNAELDWGLGGDDGASVGDWMDLSDLDDLDDAAGEEEEEDEDESGVEVELEEGGSFTTRIRSDSVRSASRARSASQLNQPARNSGAEFTLENVDTCTPNAPGSPGAHHVNVTFCSHVLHMDCMAKYSASIQSMNARSGVSVKRKEFLCPLCKKLSNILVPFSAIQKTHDSVARLSTALLAASAEAFAAKDSEAESATVASSATGSSQEKPADPEPLRPDPALFEPLGAALCEGDCSSCSSVPARRWAHWACPEDAVGPTSAESAEEWADREVLDGVVAELGFPWPAAQLALGTASAATAGALAEGATDLVMRIQNVHLAGPERPIVDDSTDGLTRAVLRAWDALWFSLASEEAHNRRQWGQKGASLMEALRSLVGGLDKHRQQWIHLVHNLREVAVSLLGTHPQRKDLALAGAAKPPLEAAGGQALLSPRRISRRMVKQTASKLQKAIKSKWRRNAAAQGNGASAAEEEEAAGVEWCELDLQVRHPLMKMVMTGACDALGGESILARWICQPLLHIQPPPHFALTKADEPHDPKSLEPGFPVSHNLLQQVERATSGDLHGTNINGLVRDASISLFDQLCSGFTGVKLAHSFDVTLEAKDYPGFHVNLSPEGRLFVSAVNQRGRLAKESKQQVIVGDYIIRLNDEPVEGMSLQTAMSTILGPRITNKRISIRRNNENQRVTITFGRLALHGALLDVRDPFLLFLTLSNAMALPSVPDRDSPPSSDAVEKDHVCTEAHVMAVRTCAIVSVLKAIIQCAWGNNPRRGGAVSRVSVTRGAATRTKTVLGLQSLAKVVVDEIVAEFVDDVPVLHVPPQDVLEGIATDTLLPFLRQTAMFFALSFGGEWSSLSKVEDSVEENKTSQLEALMVHFGLDKFHEFGKDSNSVALISKWVQAWCVANPNAPAHTAYRQLCYKAQSPSSKFSFIPLPKQYDALYSKVLNESRCPTTGGMIKEPALCLRCGAVVCGGKNCCKRRRVGAAGLHVFACCGDAGAMLMIQFSQVLLVRGQYAVLAPSPYVDSHGEQDPGLSRGRPLSFDPAIYEELERACFTHSISQRVYDTRARSERVIVANYY